MFQLTAEKLFAVLFTALHVAFIARQTGVAHFVKPFGVAVDGDFPFEKRSTAEQKQGHGIDIRNQDQKAVLKKAVPVVYPAFVAAVGFKKQLVDRTPAENGKKDGKIRKRKEKENPFPADYTRKIKGGRNAHIREPEKHRINRRTVIALDKRIELFLVQMLDGLIIFWELPPFVGVVRGK